VVPIFLSSFLAAIMTVTGTSGLTILSLGCLSIYRLHTKNAFKYPGIYAIPAIIRMARGSQVISASSLTHGKEIRIEALIQRIAAD
jgi:hypothetical protein